jgi:hypothetical protein
MKNLELYISNERVDLFDFEAINLNQKIKDVRDISKIFTDYSQSFKVPASSNNNKIFKHYYNFGIQDGYDARFKADGLIKVGGADFRFGKVRLDGVDMRENKPFAYRLVFFGTTVNLGGILGDDKLSNLDYLNKFNHAYDYPTVRSGFITGLQYDASTESMITGVAADIVYPFISCYSYYYYNSLSSDHGQPNIVPPSRNLHKHGTTGHNGIDYRDLKPSIKVRHIINAIEAKYSGLFFDKTWLDTSPFNELYLHLHRDKGFLSSVENSERVFTQQDFGVNLDLGNIVTNQYDSYTLTYSVSPVSGTGNYSLRVVDTRSGETLGYSNDLNGDGSLVIDYSVLSSEDPRNWNLNFYITTDSDSDLNTFNASLDITKRFAVFYLGTLVQYSFTDFSYTSPNSPETTASNIVVTSQIPEMKIIDFLQSIFKMFNLTAYFQRDEGVPSKSRIMIEPLNTYYSNGGVIDISDYVNIDETDISRSPIYSEINFKYDKPKTFGIKNQNELLDDEFGDLTRDNRDLNNFVSDGGKYDIKLGFEHLLYERTTDPNNVNYTTPIQYGWLVDDNQNTIKTNPIIHFVVSTGVNTTNYPVAFTGSVNQTTNPLIGQYYRPSNVNADGSQTLNFNIEYDEFTGLENTNSLYNSFYSSYVEKVFNPSTRLFKSKATLPLSILLRYKLNDVFRINGLDYNINQLKTNLLTGKSDIELVSGNFTEEVAPDAPSNIVIANRNANTITINWTVATTGIRAAYYKAYVDNVEVDFGEITYTGSTPNTPSSLLKNLETGVSYNIQVSSLSIDLAESQRSETLTASTTTNSVTPSDPSNLSVVSVTDNSVRLGWSLSFFDVNAGDTGYSIYGRVGTSGDFLFHSNVSSEEFGDLQNKYDVTGLTAGRQYQFKVRAFDTFAAQPNSGFSNTVTTQTTDVTDLVPPSIPTEFTASNITTTSVTLSWLASFNPEGTPASGYKLYQGTTLIATITTNTTYNVTGLTSGTLYKFFVSAYDANGNESDTAGPLNVTTL